VDDDLAEAIDKFWERWGGLYSMLQNPRPSMEPAIWSDSWTYYEKREPMKEGADEVQPQDG
jgi:hypothetical protein